MLKKFDADIEALIAERQGSAKKDFARADAIRDELAAQGIKPDTKKVAGHVIDVNLINGIALAFEGDAVYSMYIPQAPDFCEDDQAQ